MSSDAEPCANLANVAGLHTIPEFTLVHQHVAFRYVLAASLESCVVGIMEVRITEPNLLLGDAARGHSILLATFQHVPLVGNSRPADQLLCSRRPVTIPNLSDRAYLDSVLDLDA